MPIVYSTDGPTHGVTFTTLAGAEEWLQDNGFQRRLDQERQYVKLSGEGNLFASVVIESNQAWKPNYGRQEE